MIQTYIYRNICFTTVRLHVSQLYLTCLLYNAHNDKRGTTAITNLQISPRLIGQCIILFLSDEIRMGFLSNKRILLYRISPFELVLYGLHFKRPPRGGDTGDFFRYGDYNFFKSVVFPPFVFSPPSICILHPTIVCMCFSQFLFPSSFPREKIYSVRNRQNEVLVFLFHELSFWHSCRFW